MDKEDAVYLYNGILLSHKKNEIMPFAATWMQLEIIKLSEVSQKEKDKYQITYMWKLKYDTGTSLAVQWLKLCASNAGTQVRSLVRELRSHKL